MFLSAGLGSAFNKRAAVRQYEKVLAFCKERNIPFLELQLKLAGWKTDTFAALPGWAESMCKPVSDFGVQQNLQKIMHQGMGKACNDECRFQSAHIVLQVSHFGSLYRRIRPQAR
jgi:hypothetical protein